METLIERLNESHWPAVSRIYAEGVKTGEATFETVVPEWEVWDRNHRTNCRLVAIDDEQVVGWAALSTVSKREVYAGVAEVSVYIGETARGNGIGTKLLRALIDQSEKAGIWTLQANIFPENLASVALHSRCGFRVIGTRHHIGQLSGKWRDVLFMERRSKLVGHV